MKQESKDTIIAIVVVSSLYVGASLTGLAISWFMGLL